MRLSRLALRHPRLVLGLWAILAAVLALLGTGVEGRLTQSILTLPGTESARAIDLAKREFGQSVTVPVLLRGPTEKIEGQGPHLVRELRRRGDVRVISPWDRARGSAQLRPDPGTALIIAAIDRPYREAFDEVAPEIRGLVDRQIQAPVRSHLTGMPIIGNGLKEESYSAARRAERIAVPILVLVLLLVFRSPVAAAIPALTGLSTVLASFGAIWVLAGFFAIDPIATSLASMMGLALGVDYSLLLVSRFREELRAGTGPAEAAAAAARTAGRTVVFAGAVLVAAMVVALVLSPGDLLLSAAVGVIAATVLSVGAGVLAIPAALLLFGEHLDRWQFGGRRRGAWLAILRRPLRRPGLAAALILVPMLLLSAPALALDTGPPDVRQLPADNQARRDFEAVRRAMGPGWAAPFNLVIVSREGTITDPRRLRRISRFQRDVVGLPGVDTVIGPATVAAQTKGLRQVESSLSRGQQGLDRLAEGIAEADSGFAQLRAGLARAGRGAERLQGGSGRAARGAARIRGALGAAESGARRIGSALGRIHTGLRRLGTGSARAAAGARRLRAGTGTAKRRVRQRLVGGARRLAAGLGAGSDDLGRLLEPASTTESEIGETFRALEAMTLGKGDPQYFRALASAGRAAAAASGRDPVTGAPIRPGYDGLGAALEQASGQAAQAAGAARRLARGAERLAQGLDRLGDGARRLVAGTRRLRDGLARLVKGVGRLQRAGTGYASGIGRLGRGSQRLAGGLERLDCGAGQLAGRLRTGHARSSQLQGGLTQILSGARRLRDRVGSARRRQRRRSPGLFDSGHFTLAALEGTERRDRERVSFAINVERGGQAGDMMIVPQSGPNEPRTAMLHQRLVERAQRLGRQTDTETAVGGPAAQLADYDAATSSRLVLLILALAAVTYLVLLPVFRSVLLPLLAVVLNLLTVAASFGALALLFEGRDPLLGGPGYVDAVAISAIYTVIFGLSIDYEVFLITRMREAHLEDGDADRAIAHGLERTASVVTGAAAIMVGVFLAFALTPVANTRQFGVGLAVAVTLDATVVRLLLLPAIMRLLGQRCWWAPAWLQRGLPRADPEPAHLR